MRFPIKETVFTVFFLLINTFFVYLQPARAENTVAFKMVILPAEEKVVEDIDKPYFKRLTLISRVGNFNNENTILKIVGKFFFIHEIQKNS